MGKGLMITTLGLSLILGLIQIGIQSRQLSTTELNVGFFNQTHVRNLAGSSLEVGIHRFNDDNGWRTNGTPWIYSLGEEDIAINVDDHQSHPLELNANQVRIRALAQSENRTDSSFVIMEYNTVFPPIPGAMGFYGEGSTLDIRGNVDINGFDKNPDGTDGDGMDLPGIASVVDEETLIESSGQAYEINGEPPFSQQELDAQELQNRIDDYLPVAGIYNAPDLGSVDNPIIVKVPEGTTKISDNEGGAGILIVPVNATLELRGSFSYHGLIIVQGTLDIAGNVILFGSALFGDNSLLEIDDPDPNDATLKGNATVQYSSSALENVDQALGASINKGMTITGIFE